MKKLLALLVTLIALVPSPARATGYIYGTYAEMNRVQQWDGWFYGYPLAGNYCPPYPRYAGCLGPYGPCGNWSGWTVYYWPVEYDDELQTYRYWLDDYFGARVQQLADSSELLDWEMFDLIAANRFCVPARYFTQVYFDEIQTQESVVAELTEYWESTPPPPPCEFPPFC